VLEDPGIRDGIKEYSNWPTIPQLYIDEEFMGGCDIVKQMYSSGELHTVLGAEPPDRTPPEITVSDAAAQTIRDALRDQPGIGVHLSIDASWNHQLGLAPAEGDEIRTSANGVDILLDLASAQRARGVVIDMAESLQGRGFSIENPNAPRPVSQTSARELKAMLDAGGPLHLFDVRDAAEHERARIEGSRLLDQDTIAHIEALPRDEMIVFYCHFGPRSQAVAEHFRRKGYTNVHNLAGGVDAWSQEVDPAVTRY